MKFQKKLFLVLILLFSLSNISSQLYYNFNLTYSEDKLTENNINVIINKEEVYYNGDYKFKLFDFSDNLIIEKNFNIPNYYLYDISDEEGNIIDGGIEIIEYYNFNLLIPYYKNCKEIVFYNYENSKILYSNVSKYAQVKLEQNTIKEEKESTSQYSNNFIIVILILILIVLIVILIIRMKKPINKKNKSK